MEDLPTSKENGSTSKVKFSDSVLHRSYWSDSDNSDEDDDMQITCDICGKKFSGIDSLRQHKKGHSHKKALKKKKLLETLKQKDSDDSDDDDLLSYVMKPIKVCETCDKEFYSPESYIQHLASRDHKRKVSEGKVLEKVTEGGKVNKELLQKMLKKPDDQDNSDSDTPSAISESMFQCKECNKVFSGLAPYTQHMTSKSHEKKIKQGKMLKGVVESYSVQHSDGKGASNIEMVDEILICRMCSMSFSGPENVMAHLAGRQHAKKVRLKGFFDQRRVLAEKQMKQLEINDVAKHELKQIDDVQKSNGDEIHDAPSAKSDEINSIDQESNVEGESSVSCSQISGSECNNNSDDDSYSKSSSK